MGVGDFYPRSPCGERPVTRVARTPTTVISIHALLAESDAALLPKDGLFFLFLSTLSLRRATKISHTHQHAKNNISIHALLAESDKRKLLEQLSDPIFLSTLSLRRATGQRRSRQKLACYFYPRSPCGERLIPRSGTFRNTQNFYPRSPCGERLVRVCEFVWGVSISIHALLAESDDSIDEHLSL